MEYNMDKWLKTNYYLDGNGNTDIIVDSLGDCILQSTYLIGKNILNIPDLYVAYLNEITVMFGTSENGDFRLLHNIKNVYDKKIFKLIKHDCVNKNVQEIITELLNNRTVAVIHPIIERFPFAEAYDPEYKENKIRSLHYFLIVYEDDSNYYFVDNPSIVVKKRSNQYYKNKQIGIISKKIFIELAKDCCNIFEVKFDKDRICESICNWKTPFFNSFVNYNKPQEIIDGLRITYGKQALESMKNLFLFENLTLDDMAPSNDRNMLKYLLWKIWIIKGRRTLQKKYLESHNFDSIKDKQKVIQSIDLSVNAWEHFNIILIKNQLKGNNKLDVSYQSVIDKIISAEAELYNAYGKYFFV